MLNRPTTLRYRALNVARAWSKGWIPFRGTKV